jgi:transcriptional regulator with XRE-family HTH domain
MDTIEKLYKYFIEAFRYSINEKGRGSITSVSIDAGVSRATISKIISKNNNYKASSDLQKKISESFGFTIDKFLSLGKQLNDGNLTDIKTGIIKAVDGEYLKEPHITEKERIIEFYERMVTYLEGRMMKLEAENNELRKQLK